VSQPRDECGIGGAFSILRSRTGFLTRSVAKTIFVTTKYVVMNGTAANLSVMVGDQAACFKLAGRANFNISPEFKSLLQSLQARGVRRFILDLRECVLMDSTFVGMLARFRIDLPAVATDGTSARVELLGAGDRVDDMLDNLGVNALFGRLASEAEIPAGLSPLDLSCGSAPSPEALLKTSLQAHQTLMSLSDENQKKFAGVENCLLEDLKNIPPDPKT
jgi:anti-sigma B factor antagonist